MWALDQTIDPIHLLAGCQKIKNKGLLKYVLVYFNTFSLTEFRYFPVFVHIFYPLLWLATNAIDCKELQSDIYRLNDAMELLNLGTGTHSLILHCTGDLAYLLLTLRSIHCRTPSFWLSLFLMCEFLDIITSPIYCTKC